MTKETEHISCIRDLIMIETKQQNINDDKSISTTFDGV